MHSDAKRPRAVGDFKEPSPSDRKLHSTLPKVFGRVKLGRTLLLRALVGFGGVGGVVDLTQAIDGDVRVNLRRVETGMTQQRLQTS